MLTNDPLFNPCQTEKNINFFCPTLATLLICVITKAAQFLSPLLAPLALPLPGGLFFITNRNAVLTSALKKVYYSLLQTHYH